MGLKDSGSRMKKVRKRFRLREKSTHHGDLQVVNLGISRVHEGAGR